MSDVEKAPAEGGDDKDAAATEKSEAAAEEKPSAAKDTAEEDDQAPTPAPPPPTPTNEPETPEIKDKEPEEMTSKIEVSFIDVMEDSQVTLNVDKKKKSDKEDEEGEDEEGGDDVEIEEAGVEADVEDESSSDESSEEKEEEEGKAAEAGDKKPVDLKQQKKDELSSSEEEPEVESSEEEIEEVDQWELDQLLSGPVLAPDSTLPLNIMEFYYSFGFNCRKKYNLEVLDDTTLIFASGNYLNFFNLETRELTFRRTALGGGVGHIKKNPNPEYKHFSVAECGKRPIIILYKWPDFSVDCILRGGAKRLYSCLDYSPDGELLVSQSGEPDFMLTVWNWKKHTILLRNKSYINDVYKVMFSPYLAGHITTAGVAHIKFWKMAQTFTGLKLQGELGRFGKTEYSDILGVMSMPDEKVISGSDWGNILIWDGGLIALEVLRTGRRPCHDGPIVQFYFEEEELWTVSLDGHVKIWWYEKIDTADPSDEDPTILLDPSYDFYTPGMSLVSIVRRRENESLFIAQDGNGGIWQIDLNTVDTPTESIQYYKCHAGKIVDIAPCSFGPYLASLGKEGQIFIYNYLTKKFLYNYQFPSNAHAMVWPSTTIIPSGDIIIGGFADGQVRVVCLYIPNLSKGGNENDISITLTQVIKTHTKPVTAVTINATGNIVVSGSDDATIFIYKVNNKELNNFLIPIGFLPAPDSITYMTWNPKEVTTILVGCIQGQMMEVLLPIDIEEDTFVSYELKKPQPKYLNFLSYKSQIKRDIHLGKVARHKERKRQRKLLEMVKLQAENPGMEIDEDLFLADSSDEEDLEPLYIPPKQRIFWLQYTDDDTIWVSMSGYDAGYIYEYSMGQEEPAVPLRCTLIDGAADTEIFSFAYDSQRNYLMFGMENGSIRVNKINKDNWRNLSDYWILTMHDNQYSYVPKMCFSYDETIFFSCGYDGNIFASYFNHESYEAPPFVEPTVRQEIPIKVPDVDTDIKNSLEEIKYKAEQDRINKSTNAHKARVREQIKELKDRYLKILNRNSKLLPTQIIPREDLEPDKRILDYVTQMFDNNIVVVRKKADYELQKSEVLMKKLLRYFTDPADRLPIIVRGINKPELMMISLRQRLLSPMFHEMMKLCVEKLEEERIKGRPVERAREPPKPPPLKIAKSVPLEYFLLSLTPSQRQRKMGPKLTRMLQKYRIRRDKWERRQEEWEEFLSKKPDPMKNHPEDEKFLAEALLNIGDYKLKEADDYKAPPEERDTTVKKYKQVLDTRQKQFDLRHALIEKAYQMRTFKYEVIARLKKYENTLKKIHEELPEELHQFGPEVPDVDPEEFPEEKLRPVFDLPEEIDELLEEQARLPHVPEPTPEDKIRQILPERETYPVEEGGVFFSNFEPADLADTIDADLKDILRRYSDERTDNPLEAELRARTLTKKLFIQRTTIIKMNEEIDGFNSILEEAKDIVPTQLQGLFIDLYILTLNQELNILKKMEDGEQTLMTKCSKSLRLVHNFEDYIDIEKNKKIEIENAFENNFLEESKIQEKFKHVAENDKFYDFLRRVFRKKYRPAKVTTDSDSESESSSSSSEESVEDDDASSIDSKDLGIIKQDVNVCPKGCEVAIFNLTVELRGQRHEIEQNNRELTRQLEITNKNIDLASKKLHMLTNYLQNNLHDLEVYQKERQDLLNQIKCTVVLNLDQIQNYNPETDEISNFLVFSKSKLSQLYKRVGVLEYENLQQKTKYETYLKHLTRMKRDITYMDKKIKHLLRKIQLSMYEKFGKSVELKELEEALAKKTFNKTYINELEEVILKKLVYEIRVKNTNVKEVYGAQIQHINQKIRNAQDALIRCVKENTNRLELLQVINKEKKELVKVISTQPKRREQLEKVFQTTSEYEKDVKKLETILENQNRTLFELKAEIKMLKSKGMPPKENYDEMRKKEEELEKQKKFKEDSENDWPEEVENYIKQHEDELTSVESVVEEEEEKVIEVIEAMDEKEEPQVVLLHESTSPEFYLTESEDIVMDMLDKLMSGLKLKSQVEIDKANIVKNIMHSIMNCVSVSEIVKEIIENLPFDVTPKQTSIIEKSAEKIQVVQSPDMSEMNILKYAKDLLEETLEEILSTKADPYDNLMKLLEELVSTVPKEFLLDDRSIDSVVDKVKIYIHIHEVVIDIWVEKVESIESPLKDDVIEFLNIILERVYGTGVDYFYIINKRKG
ncbi:unnamed protein product [Phyllotreta striolata]|uniref:Cilia- and flagella-associated protein 44 n=1 Tax=Phyllotreta striolata TaxID=444603 RepID=A0A9N9TNC8_PHYSR|nr:unnamed protein product [Phyllotreta striolata]